MLVVIELRSGYHSERGMKGFLPEPRQGRDGIRNTLFSDFENHPSEMMFITQQ